MDQKFKHTDLKLGDQADKLSAQQRVILLMICMGLTDKMIAKAICRSPETVKSHVKILFILFGVDSRTALVREACCHRLVVPVMSIFFALLILPATFTEHNVRRGRSPGRAQQRIEHNIHQGAIV